MTKSELNIIRKTNEIKNSFKDIQDYSYDILDYKNNTTKIKFKCNKHNKIIEQFPSDHIKKHIACKECQDEIQYLKNIDSIKNKALYLLEGSSDDGSILFSKIDLKKLNEENKITKQLFHLICPKCNNDLFLNGNQLNKKSKCSCNNINLKTQNIIEKINNKYPHIDCSKMTFETLETKSKFHCTKCNKDFTKRIDGVIKKGCTHCNNKATFDKITHTKEDWINKSKKKYNDNFDYSIIEDNKEPFNKNKEYDFICKKHNNIFKNTFTKHFNSKVKHGGCKECFKEAYQDPNKYENTEKSISKLNNHKVTYIPKSLKFTEEKNTFDVQCKCGHISTHNISNKLKKLKCKKCESTTSKMDLETFKIKSKKKHNKKIEKYNYENIKFKGNYVFDIYCNKCEANFSQLKSVHLGGSGCQKCCSGGYKTNKKGIIYILEFENKTTNNKFLKVGITNSSIKQRFSKDINNLNIKEILLKTFDDGKKPPIIEKKILKHFSQYKIENLKELKFGNTECFDNKLEEEPLFKKIINKYSA